MSNLGASLLWGVAKGSSISWLAKFKGDKTPECKLSNGRSRSYRETKLLLSSGIWVVTKIQGDKSASHSSMELMTHGFLDPSAFPDSTQCFTFTVSELRKACFRQAREHKLCFLQAHCFIQKPLHLLPDLLALTPAFGVADLSSSASIKGCSKRNQMFLPPGENGPFSCHIVGILCDIRECLRHKLGHRKRVVSKGWFWRMFLGTKKPVRNEGTKNRNDGTKNRNEGTFPKTTLL